MNYKPLFLFFIAFISVNLSAQKKVYTFSEFQSRNSLQQWDKCKKVEKQTASFTNDEINLFVDKNYHLKIVSKTLLPDNGIIYLCKDENLNNVTVMLLNDDKMFLYNNTKRFKISLTCQAELTAVAQSFVNAE